MLPAWCGWADTPKRVLAIRLDFPDNTAEPITQQELESRLAAVSDQFYEMSFGKTSLVVTATPTVLRMPQTVDHYIANGGYSALGEDARTAATDAGFSLEEFDIYSYAFANVFPYGIGDWGIHQYYNGYMGIPQMMRSFAVSYGLGGLGKGWVSVDGKPASRSGLHLDGSPAEHREWGDPYDVMGLYVENAHFNMFYKAALNWITPSQVVRPTVSGTYRIYRFDHAEASRCPTLALQLNDKEGETYWLGYRGGLSENASMSTGAYMALQESDNSSIFLDMTPGSDVIGKGMADDLDDGTLPLGASFTDQTGAFTISVVSCGGSDWGAYIDVHVSLTSGDLPPDIEKPNFDLYTSDDESAGGLVGSYFNMGLRHVDEIDWRSSQTVAGQRVDGEETLSFLTNNWGARADVAITGGSDGNWENFSVQWDGFLRVRKPVYLSTRSDDSSRFWIDLDGSSAFELHELVNNHWGRGQGFTRGDWSPIIPPGLYPIRIQYEEGVVDNRFALDVRESSRPFALFTDSAENTLGLTGSYVDQSLRARNDRDDWRVSQTIAGTRVDRSLFFRDSLGSRADVGLTHGSDENWDDFSVQWDGYIRIMESCRIATRSDDSSRFWIDVNDDGVFDNTSSELVDNHWGSGQNEVYGDLSDPLPPGSYRIRIQYEEGVEVNRFGLVSFPSEAPQLEIAGYTSFEMEGFTVLVEDLAFTEDASATTQMLRHVSAGLRSVGRLCANREVLAFWRSLRIFVHWNRDDSLGGYYPQSGGGDIGSLPNEIRGSIEFFSVESIEGVPDALIVLLFAMPLAYHDQVIGFDDPEIVSAYDSAVANGLYAEHGLRHVQDYFQEVSMAYFRRSELHPSSREDLRSYDPQGYEIAQSAWGQTECSAEGFLDKLYLEDFDLFANGTTDLLDGSTMQSNDGTTSVQEKALRLTAAETGGTLASFAFPPVDASQGWKATFDFSIIGGSFPADGFSFNYGAIPEGLDDQVVLGERGYATSVPHLSFQIDTFRNFDNVDDAGVGVGVNGVRTAFTEAVDGQANVFANETVHGKAFIYWDPAKGATFWTAGLRNDASFFQIDTSSFAVSPDHGFSITARTGGFTETVTIDNLCIISLKALEVSQGQHILSQSSLAVDSVSSVHSPLHTGTAVIDGDESTFWHTEWDPNVVALPHEIVIRTDELYEISGLAYTPREGGSTGSIEDFQIFVSQDGIDWGEAVVTGKMSLIEGIPKRILFPKTIARYVKLVAVSESEGAAPIAHSPIAHWPLDEITDGMSPDMAGSRHMTANNLTEADIVEGWRGNAIAFDAARETILHYTAEAGQATATSNPAYTVALWAKVNGTGQNDLRLFSEASTTSNTPLFNLGTANDGADGSLDLLLRTQENGTPYSHSHTTAMPFDDTWHHVAFTQEQGGQIAVYIDGILDDMDTTTLVPEFGGGINTTTIGGILRATPSNFVTGVIDDVKIWDVALTADQVAAEVPFGPTASVAELNVIHSLASVDARFVDIISQESIPTEGGARMVSFRFYSIKGSSYRVESSPDMSNWMTIDDFEADSPITTIEAALPSDWARIFFRVVRY